MKKILVVSNTGLVNAGVPNVIMSIVRNLKNTALFDILVLDSADNYFDEEFKNAGGKIYKLKLWDYSKYKVLFPFRGIKLFFTISNILKNGNYDIIHCHNGIESGICVIAAKAFGVKETIVHCHGKYDRKGKNFLLRTYNFLCKFLIRNYATKMITCSTEAGYTLFGNSKEVIKLLNPVDVSKYYTPTKNKKERKNFINILQIGYFCKNKNQLYSLELVNVLKRQNVDIHLSFIGYESENGYLNLMKKYIKDNNMENNVSFFPHDYNKELIFESTDALLLPSYSEAAPLVLLEAQSAGVKCIASTSVPNDVDLGLCAYVSVDNRESWAHMIRNIKNIDLQLDKDKLVKVDISYFINRITKIYGVTS